MNNLIYAKEKKCYTSSNVESLILPRRATLVNYFVRYLPKDNPYLHDQVNLKQKSKELGFKKKWYIFWKIA